LSLLGASDYNGSYHNASRIDASSPFHFNVSNWIGAGCRGVLITKALPEEDQRYLIRKDKVENVPEQHAEPRWFAPSEFGADAAKRSARPKEEKR
jgi:hypothetical protein